MSTYRLWGLSAAAIVGLWVVIPSTGCGGSNSATTGPGDDASVSDGSDDGASDCPYVRMCGNGIQDPGEQCDQGAQTRAVHDGHDRAVNGVARPWWRPRSPVGQWSSPRFRSRVSAQGSGRTCQIPPFTDSGHIPA